MEQRLCCWLLMTHDRVQAADFQMTQEFISNMWGCAAKVSRMLRIACKRVDEQLRARSHPDS
jgi:hypothetical protein